MLQCSMLIVGTEDNVHGTTSLVGRNYLESFFNLLSVSLTITAQLQHLMSCCSNVGCVQTETRVIL